MASTTSPPPGFYDPGMPASPLNNHASFSKQTRSNIDFSSINSQNIHLKARLNSLATESSPGPGSYIQAHTDNKDSIRTPPLIFHNSLEKTHVRKILNQSFKKDTIKVVPSIPDRQNYIYEDIGEGMLVAFEVKNAEKKQKTLLNQKTSKNKILTQLPKIAQRKQAQLDKQQYLVGKSIPISKSQYYQNDIFDLRSSLHKTMDNTLDETVMSSKKFIQKADGYQDISKILNNTLPTEILEDSNLQQADHGVEEDPLRHLCLERLAQLNKLYTPKAYQSPGPGYYELVNINKLTSFSTKSTLMGLGERFPDLGNGVPGPGRYRYRLVPQKVSHNIGGTISKNARAVFDEQIENRPGPGTYNVQDTAKNPTCRTTQLEHGSSFGSGQIRFASSTPKLQYQAGPGSYNISQKLLKKRHKFKVVNVYVGARIKQLP